MLGSRNQTLSKEIDTARCVGHWSSIAGLAAKYAKHNPGGHVFSSIISCEAKLEELLLEIAWNPNSHWKDEGSAMDDGQRRRIYYPMHLSSSASVALEPLENEMRQISEGHKMTEEETFQLSVVLGKICFYGGRFDACSKALQGLPQTIKQDFGLSPAYGKQLFMAQMVMSGVLLEMGGDLKAAHAVYEAALDGFSEKTQGSA
ncbi:hypothetical protein LPJ56_000987, partial [Coemansia sp. RSA 2599]